MDATQCTAVHEVISYYTTTSNDVGKKSHLHSREEKKTN